MAGNLIAREIEFRHHADLIIFYNCMRLEFHRAVA